MVDVSKNIFEDTCEAILAACRDVEKLRLRRRTTRQTDVRGLKIGGGAHVLIQSMTGSKTSNVEASLLQIKQLFDAGSQMVRIAFRDHDDAQSLPIIKDRLVNDGYGDVRLVLCMHYNGHVLLAQHPECVEIADKFRINPGNVGFADRWDSNFADIIRIVSRFPKKAIRIGVNWGSLDESMQSRIMDIFKGESAATVETIALVASAIMSARFAEQLDFDPNQIVISCKVSDPSLTFVVNSCLAAISDYPLHLGVTEAGEGDSAIVATACGLAPLLTAGIGDTIRASLTDHRDSPRSREVEVCKLILQSLGIKNYSPSVNSCPGCGRAKGDSFRFLAKQIKDFVDMNLSTWKKDFVGIEDLRVAVMGCIVNGPGESKKAHIGISLPGFGEGEQDVAVVYKDGAQFKVLRGDINSILAQSKEIILQYLQAKAYVMCEVA